jgi:hypothetical protein
MRQEVHVIGGVLRLSWICGEEVDPASGWGNEEGWLGLMAHLELLAQKRRRACGAAMPAEPVPAKTRRPSQDGIFRYYHQLESTNTATCVLAVAVDRPEARRP